LHADDRLGRDVVDVDLEELRRASTTTALISGTLTPMLPMALTAPRATALSVSVTYSESSSTISPTLAAVAMVVRISSLSSLTHAGSLYRQ